MAQIRNSTGNVTSSTPPKRVGADGKKRNLPQRKPVATAPNVAPMTGQPGIARVTTTTAGRPPRLERQPAGHHRRASCRRKSWNCGWKPTRILMIGTTRRRAVF